MMTHTSKFKFLCPCIPIFHNVTDWSLYLENCFCLWHDCERQKFLLSRKHTTAAGDKKLQTSHDWEPNISKLTHRCKRREKLSSSLGSRRSQVQWSRQVPVQEEPFRTKAAQTLRVEVIFRVFRDCMVQVGCSSDALRPVFVGSGPKPEVPFGWFVFFAVHQKLCLHANVANGCCMVTCPKKQTGANAGRACLRRRTAAAAGAEIAEAEAIAVFFEIAQSRQCSEANSVFCPGT